MANASSRRDDRDGPPTHLGAAIGGLIPRWLRLPFLKSPSEGSQSVHSESDDEGDDGTGDPGSVPEAPTSPVLQREADENGILWDRGAVFRLSDPVEASSLKIAETRAAESLRPPGERLFRDPLALAICASYENIQQPRTARLAIRTRFFDDFLSDAVSSGIDQVVILGSGMDSRPWRVDALRSRGVVVYDVDLESVLKLKAEVMQAMDPSMEMLAEAVIPVSADVSNNGWDAHLVTAGFDWRRPSAWILEGLVYYIEEERVDAMLRTLRSLACRGSIICMSIVGTSAATSGGGSEFGGDDGDTLPIDVPAPVGRFAANGVMDPRPRSPDGLGVTPPTNGVTPSTNGTHLARKGRDLGKEDQVAITPGSNLSSLFVFRCPNPRLFLTKLRFEVESVVSPGTNAASYGRWPKDAAPVWKVAYVTFRPGLELA